MDFLGRSLSPGRSLGSKRFFEDENPLKMHTLSINFISFTAKMYAYARQKGDFGILGGMTPLAPLNPPMLEQPYRHDLLAQFNH